MGTASGPFCRPAHLFDPRQGAGDEIAHDIHEAAGRQPPRPLEEQGYRARWLMAGIIVAYSVDGANNVVSRGHAGVREQTGAAHTRVAPSHAVFRE